MRVCCLRSHSAPHLLHWFTPNLTPLTLQSHLLTEWQPTLPYRNSTHSQCPACWGSYQSSCRTPGPLGRPSEMAHPRHLFLCAPPSPSSPTPGSSPPPLSLWATQVYTSSVKPEKKMYQPSWNTQRCAGMGWINADIEPITFSDMHKKYIPNLDCLQVAAVSFWLLEDKSEAQWWSEPCLLGLTTKKVQNLYATSNLILDQQFWNSLWCHCYKEE